MAQSDLDSEERSISHVIGPTVDDLIALYQIHRDFSITERTNNSELSGDSSFESSIFGIERQQDELELSHHQSNPHEYNWSAFDDSSLGVNTNYINAISTPKHQNKQNEDEEKPHLSPQNEQVFRKYQQFPQFPYKIQKSSTHYDPNLSQNQKTPLYQFDQHLLNIKEQQQFQDSQSQSIQDPEKRPIQTVQIFQRHLPVGDPYRKQFAIMYSKHQQSFKRVYVQVSEDSQGEQKDSRLTQKQKPIKQITKNKCSIENCKKCKKDKTQTDTLPGCKGKARILYERKKDGSSDEEENTDFFNTGFKIGDKKSEFIN